MKIEFNAVHNVIIVTDKEGKVTVISCTLGSYDNTRVKGNENFSIAKNILEEIGKIIYAAEQSV